MKVRSKKYVKESISQVEKRIRIEIRKENVPINSKLHPKLDDTPLLDEENITKYQRLIGILQWMQTLIRLDISLAVLSLARFQYSSREEHMSTILKIFRYLKKYPK